MNIKGSLVHPSPFKIPSDESEIEKVIELNNYTNQCLKTIGKQLDKIKTHFDDYSTSNISASKPLYKPLINLPSTRKRLSLVTQGTIEDIEQLFTKLSTLLTKKELLS